MKNNKKLLNKPTKKMDKINEINRILKMYRLDYKVYDDLKADEINILYNTIYGMGANFSMNYEKRIFALKSWIDALISANDYCYLYKPFVHKVGDQDA